MSTINIRILKKRSLQFLLLAILIFSSVSLLNAQKSLTWEVLSNVKFNKQYDETIKAYWLVPTFGARVKAYENKTVIVEGYFIPVDTEGKFYVLSKYPYSSCFFCGGAGPESIVELQVSKKLVKHISMDERVQFQGKFALNVSDFKHCNYILKGARPLKKKE